MNYDNDRDNSRRSSDENGPSKRKRIVVGKSDNSNRSSDDAREKRPLYSSDRQPSRPSGDQDDSRGNTYRPRTYDRGNSSDSGSGYNRSNSSGGYNRGGGYDRNSGSGYNRGGGQGYNRPEGGDRYNRSDSGNSYNRPDSGNSYNRPDSGNSYNRPDSGERGSSYPRKDYGNSSGYRSNTGSGYDRGNNSGFRKSYGGDDRRSGYSSRGTDDRSSGGYNRSSGDDRRSGGYDRNQGKPFIKKSYGSSGGSSSGGFRKPYNRDGQGGGDRRQYGSQNRGFQKPAYRSEGPGQQPDYHFETDTTNAPIRLNKYIANTGLCSRREADEYIQAGLITVNGVLVTELGVKVQPTDEVRYNNERLKQERKVYILLNKPKDYVTSVDDPHAKRTVMELIEGACRERIYPVGRLDRMTTGVLLLTNDGELTKKLTHPTSNIKKIYQVHLDKAIKHEDLQAISEGIVLDDGFIQPDKVGYVFEDDSSVIGVEIHSGRNRIVRRIFEYFGYKVVKLDRVFFGGLTKKALSRGKWRYLAPREVGFLKMMQV